MDELAGKKTLAVRMGDRATRVVYAGVVVGGFLCLPYLAIVILCMVLMYQFPGIALWFPDYLFGVWVP